MTAMFSLKVSMITPQSVNSGFLTPFSNPQIHFLSYVLEDLLNQNDSGRMVPNAKFTIFFLKLRFLSFQQAILYPILVLDCK